MNKEEIRQKQISIRNQLSKEDIVKKSKSIASNFFSIHSLNFKNITYLHLFLPMQNRNEVNTYFILDLIQEKFPSIKIVLSKSNFSDQSMQLFEYLPDTILIENSFGIPEPIGGQQVNPNQLDVAVVPLLAFDISGNRIGYGKGFYDRLLASCRPDCIKIGLSFEGPITSIIPDIHDISLNFCITPTKIYDFKTP